MRVLTQNGDEKVEWNPADGASVKAAKKEFARLKKAGYLFYEVTDARGKQIERFDKNLGQIIAAPGARSEADKGAQRRPLAMAGGPTARKTGKGLFEINFPGS